MAGNGLTMEIWRRLGAFARKECFASIPSDHPRLWRSAPRLCATLSPSQPIAECRLGLVRRILAEPEPGTILAGEKFMRNARWGSVVCGWIALGVVAIIPEVGVAAEPGTGE